jgi:hypothetical protein
LFPVGAWALSFSNVAITDPGGVNQAKVNNAGQLSAAVKGAVTATPAAASQFFHKWTIVGTGPVVAATPPPGKALIVTSLQLDWFGTDFANDPYVFFEVGDATCTSFVEGGNDFFEIDLPNANDGRTIPITPGWPIPAGDALCVQKGGGTSFTNVMTFGYLVPANSVPPLAIVKGANISPLARR